MTTQTLEQRIKKVICEQLDVPEPVVLADTNLAADLGADSFDSFELMLALENEFDIEFSDSEWEGVSTPASIVALVNQKAGVAA